MRSPRLLGVVMTIEASLIVTRTASRVVSPRIVVKVLYW